MGVEKYIDLEQFPKTKVRKYAKNNCQYKNYILRYATHREYEEFVKNQQSA